MKNNGTKVFTLMISLVAIIALGYYIHLNNNAPTHHSPTVNSEREKLLNYDMDHDYPKTVREAVKLHCRFLKYVYGDDFKKEGNDDDLFALNKKIRQLYDEELLENNSMDAQLAALRSEIEMYETTKRKFVSYSPAEASQIEYNTVEGVEYAKIRVTVAMLVDGASFSLDEEYILRKDQNARWKILGWQAVKPDSKKEK